MVDPSELLVAKRIFGVISNDAVEHLLSVLELIVDDVSKEFSPQKMCHLHFDVVQRNSRL